MRYLTYPERQAWEPLKRGDVVLAKGLADGRDVVFLLLGETQADFAEKVGLSPAWECLILHSEAKGLEAGALCTPDESFLETGERL